MNLPVVASVVSDRYRARFRSVMSLTCASAARQSSGDHLAGSADRRVTLSSYCSRVQIFLTIVLGLLGRCDRWRVATFSVRATPADGSHLPGSFVQSMNRKRGRVTVTLRRAVD